MDEIIWIMRAIKQAYENGDLEAVAELEVLLK